MTEARERQIMFKGKPVTLLGYEAKVGDKARNFTVLDQTLSPVSLEDAPPKIRLISAVPSLDTPVCDAQTRLFNEVAAKLADNVEIITISMDLPFAQKRWSGAAGIDRVKIYSDHRDAHFGIAFGVLIKELRLLARAVFVVDEDGVIRYTEYVKEVTEHPDYDKVLNFVKSISVEPKSN